MANTGRPRLGDDCQEQVTFTVPRNIKAGYYLHARKEGMGEASKLFRKALKEYAENHKISLEVPADQLRELQKLHILRHAK